MLRRILLAGALAILPLAGMPLRAGATTGPLVILPASPYKVDSRVQRLYTGAYELRSIAKGARIRTCALGIEVRDGTLRGLAQFYGYDLEGNLTLWVATLYNFHVNAKSLMVIDLLGPTGAPLMGRLYVSRAGNGDLRGHLQLPFGIYAASWHRVARSWTPTKG
jgi:hypothetical protein